ncbi:MAG: hypothetical protein HYT78_04060 [Deltaproteobacteria bacterium]|nr:hypothetical protein [Deltaproteobacteria bacterium]
MEISEAIELVRANAKDEEVDGLLVELLRAPSPQTEKLEADPALRAFVRETVDPLVEALTGARAQIDGMGKLRWPNRMREKSFPENHTAFGALARWEGVPASRRGR